MITIESFITIRCDSCNTPILNSFDDDGDMLLLDIETSDKALAHQRRCTVAFDGWSEDGEGKIHCPSCPTLELTQEAKEERRRDLERTGLTLFDLEGTTP